MPGHPPAGGAALIRSVPGSGQERSQDPPADFPFQFHDGENCGKPWRRTPFHIEYFDYGHKN